MRHLHSKELWSRSLRMENLFFLFRRRTEIEMECFDDQKLRTRSALSESIENKHFYVFLSAESNYSKSIIFKL